MRKISIVFASLLLFVTSATVLAQDDEDRDVLEVSIFGGLAIPTGGITNWNDGLDASTGTAFGLAVGYFVTPNITTGLNFTFQQFDVDNAEASSTNHRLYSPMAYARYIVHTEGNWEPFAAVQLGLENPKFTTRVFNDAQNRFRAISYAPAFAYGISAGLFYYTADYSGLFFEASYHGAISNSVDANYAGTDYVFNENISTFNLHIGIRLLVGSDE